MENNKEYLKEALKLETEKLKIYAAYFAGLFAVLGNIVLKNDFAILYLVTLFITVMLLFLIGVALGNSLLKTSNYLKLLKK